jgi:hypothetical protein
VAYNTITRLRPSDSALPQGIPGCCSCPELRLYGEIPIGLGQCRLDRERRLLQGFHLRFRRGDDLFRERASKARKRRCRSNSGSARADEHTIRLRALRQGLLWLMIVQASTTDVWPRRPVVFAGGLWLLLPKIGPPFLAGPGWRFRLSPAIPALPKGPHCRSQGLPRGVGQGDAANGLTRGWTT